MHHCWYIHKVVGIFYRFIAFYCSNLWYIKIIIFTNMRVFIQKFQLPLHINDQWHFFKYGESKVNNRIKQINCHIYHISYKFMFSHTINLLLSSTTCDFSQWSYDYTILVISSVLVCVRIYLISIISCL